MFKDIKDRLEKDYYEHKTIYDSLNIDLNVLLNNLNNIIDKLQEKIAEIESKNEVINIIISSLKDLNTELSKIKGNAETEIASYNNEKDEFINIINTVISDHYNNLRYPEFPSPLSGIISKSDDGYIFIRKAAFHDKNLEDDFYNELFNSDHSSKEKIMAIKDQTEYKNALKFKDNFKLWREKKVDQFISKYISCEEYIKEADDTGTDVSTPGEIATVFYKYKFDTIRDCKTIIINQPEDDICSATIYNKLIHYFNHKRDNVQIIFSTHNPMLVVNLDVDNVIVLEKK